MNNTISENVNNIDKSIYHVSATMLIFLALYSVILTIIVIVFFYNCNDKVKNTIWSSFPNLDDITSGKATVVIQCSLGACLSFVFVCFFHNFFFSQENEYLRSFYFVMYSLISPVIGIFTVKVIEDIKDFQINKNINKLDAKQKLELREKYNENLKKKTEKLL